MRKIIISFMVAIFLAFIFSKSTTQSSGEEYGTTAHLYGGIDEKYQLPVEVGDRLYFNIRLTDGGPVDVLITYKTMGRIYDDETLMNQTLEAGSRPEMSFRFTFPDFGENSVFYLELRSHGTNTSHVEVIYSTSEIDLSDGYDSQRPVAESFIMGSFLIWVVFTLSVGIYLRRESARVERETG